MGANYKKHRGKVLVGRDGLSTLLNYPCPTRCGNMVVYNGNFFCDNFDFCGWAAICYGEKGYDPKQARELSIALSITRHEEPVSHAYD